MKQHLSLGDIQFIDSYLTKSGICFTDIKIEMIDHVASEINQQIEDGDSRGFYYIFKDFMVENKSTIMKVEDKFYRASDRKILKNLYKKICSIKGVSLLLAIFFSFRLLENILNLEQVFILIKYIPFVVMILGSIFYIFMTRIKKERFSSLERIGLYFFVISEVIYIFFNPFVGIKPFAYIKLVWCEIGSSLIIFFLILLTVSAFEFKKEFHINYNIASS